MDLQRDLVIHISSSFVSLLSMLVGAEQREGQRHEMLLAERFIQARSTCCDAAVLPSGCSFYLPEVRSWMQVGVVGPLWAEIWDSWKLREGNCAV